jgi:hypothetical protein
MWACKGIAWSPHGDTIDVSDMDRTLKSSSAGWGALPPRRFLEGKIKFREKEEKAKKKKH